MLRKFMRVFLLGLVLLLVFCASMLLAMRFAIHGREVRVPQLGGLTPAEAERVANGDGLVLSVESRFYTPSVPKGRIASQSPVAGARVRRGWKLVAAESLGPQQAAIPNLLGQSEHAAGMNIGRRGLEVGLVARVHLPGAPAGTVIAQSPAPNARDAASPKISLLLAAGDNAPHYVMPNFAGKPITEATTILAEAGFRLGQVRTVAGSSNRSSGAATGIVVKQHPLPGQKVSAGTAIDFEVSRF
jgi:beta-lactam-binding protein with PASTA domain